jgi:3-deoxy-manno-octulosonate cytidylyltransferase (CMP-KDO synthetase)
MQFIGIIPARYDSTRFPGKPLAMINGISMIERVYKQALKAKVLTDVYVATDDQRIEKHVIGFGGKVIMTSPLHQTGTERCFEAAGKLQAATGLKSSDVIINIQGDEPYIDPLQIAEVAACFKNEQVEIATLVKKITDQLDLFNPNVVKCMVTNNNKAIYFSRQAVPHIRNKTEKDWLSAASFYKHIGIYAYRYAMLEKIVKLEQSPLEISESLEQLRWIQNEIPVYVGFTDIESSAVDVPEDIKKFINYID